MQKNVLVTPCPVAEPQLQSHRRDSLFSHNGDTTTDFDFTTEFRASLKNVKPRRRQTTVRKQNVMDLGFTIHEEEEAHIGRSEDGRMAQQNRLMTQGRRETILQPPQRQKPRVSFAPTDLSLETGSGIQSLASSLSQAPRRPILRQESKRKYGPVIQEETTLKIPSPKMSKPARRGTIYIPSDDTTMPSLYMGIFSPIKDFDINTHDGNEDPGCEITGIAAVMAKKKSSRKSILAASPKRGPLQPSTRLMQATAFGEMQVGNGPGKENLPPGHSLRQLLAVKNQTIKRRVSLLEPTRTQQATPEIWQAPKPRPRSSAFAPTASSAGRVKEVESTFTSKPKPQWVSGTRHMPNQPTAISRKVLSTSTANPNPEPQVSKQSHVPSRFVIPNINPGDVQQQYPVLPEGVADSTMYEDNWLHHQEIAIAQLVNNLFDTASPKIADGDDQSTRRTQLLDLYSGAEMSMLYKRAQGALLYGGLSISQDIVDGARRLSSDLGKRKAFTDFWLTTYDVRTLQAGLEVVIGRQCVNYHQNTRISQMSLSDPSVAQRRSLREFIERFLIQNEDGEPESNETTWCLWSYQRTCLRSLMLIKLLDLTRTATDIPIGKTLFQKSSSYKSSKSVVQALIQMLNPNTGDPSRVLSHIGYKVDHSQYALEEYIYHIDNLAVDLRDGVCLTRLVELLLYPSASKSLALMHDAGATTTILLPSGELLSSIDGQSDWPLSQHLKFPCPSRAAKIFNVQVALSAIQAIKGMEIVVQGIKAEDIVDGFREKTVKLLWGMTSKWGLGGLIDWNDVKREIKRLSRNEGSIGIDDMDLLDIVEDEDEVAHVKHKALLKMWARAVAGSRSIKVRNFTTSFADGRVFGAIVDEYEPYLTGWTEHKCKQPLSDRLQALGCNAQFAQLFSIHVGSMKHTHIFDRDFVLAALAFLCSRLMGSSKASRAGTAIQKAWRRHWEKVMKRRQRQLKVMAIDCAEAVNRKERLLRAKPIIWNAWCRYQKKKVIPLHGIEAVHALGQEMEASIEDIWLSL